MKTTKKWFIYLLIDPRVTSGRAQDEVRYVGVTVDANFRLKSHIKSANDGLTNRCYNWLRRILNDSFEPVMKVVDEGFGPSWEDAERFWIRFYREEVGADLTNMTDGGDGTINCVHSDEFKLKISGHLNKHWNSLLEPDLRSDLARIHGSKADKSCTDERRRKVSISVSAYWQRRKAA